MNKDLTKPCITCGAVERYKKSGACRPCNLKMLAKNRAENPDYDKNWQKNNPERKLMINRKCRYGITEEQYLDLFNKQNGKCAICLVQNVRDIDHCHSSGRIRGLLCNPCNVLLGLAKDNPEVLRLAADYLEKE